MKKRIRILSGILSAVMVVGMTGFNITDKISADEIVDVEVTDVKYTFTNSMPGYANGTIAISSTQDEEFTLYWGDKNGAKLKRDGVLYSELATVTTVAGKGSYKVPSSYAAIPYGAAKLLVYSEKELEYTYTIPTGKLFNQGTKQYSFGLVSDVHYSRYNASGGDDADGAFNKALNFLENKSKVKFVGATGDLSSNSENSSFIKFNNEVKKHKIPVFSCMGNHDVYNTEGWKKYINVGINSKNASKMGILQVADNEIDFVYQNPASKSDVFIFLSQRRWTGQNSTIALLLDDQLNWIEEMLDVYADKNVYLFFHTYLATNTGDITKCVGNLKTPMGYSYDLTYTYGIKDEKKLRSLLKKHSNVTMFGGHSHWAYEMQKYNENLNIGNLGAGTATLVHVSSVTEPRVEDPDKNGRIGLNNTASEAMVADVYNGVTVYTGVDVWNSEYYAYATYIAPKGKKTTAVKIKYPKKPKISKVTRKKSSKTKMTVKFAKVKNAKKYELQYSTSKKFKSSKTTTKLVKKTTVKLKKLNKKKKYYVRVRAYNVAYGRKRYSSWSKVKAK